MKRTSRRGSPPVPLPAVLDLSAASSLASALLERRGAAVVLDGAGVERVGGQCLQVLLAACATWRADGKDFAIGQASAALVAGLAALGAAGLIPITAPAKESCA